MSEELKGHLEVAVFKEFSEKSPKPIIPHSIRKSLPPHPDICCEIEDEGRVWFELTEACAPVFKQLLNSPPDSGLWVGWGEDSSAATVEKKIQKKYPVKEPIELLLYTNWATALTDQDLLESIQSILKKGAGPFRKVWLLGDDIHELWSAY